MIGFLGVAFFSNAGLLALVYIFVSQWSKGEMLDESISVSLMAMVFLLFLTVNQLTYFGMTSTQTFLAIIFRISSVFEMEEY